MTAQPNWQATPTRSAPASSGGALTIRDLRFSREHDRTHAGDPVAAAWFASLSASFPRGEAMFIEAVKAFRDDAPPELAAEIRAFIRQEVNHTREHLAFNRAVAAAGYDMREIDESVNRLVDLALSRPPIVQLAVTIALEHFTAVFAHEFLEDPTSLATGGIGDPAMWAWHSVEEIEHKGVAYDTWLNATRHWSAGKRWRVRCLLMLVVSRRFLFNRSSDALKLMAQDGITGWRARWRLAKYLIGKPGILRKIFPAWLGYFRPGFHPWDHDDRHLIAAWEREQAAVA